MATLKEVQEKIAGVKKTKQITKAMNMVASSKLRGAKMKMESFRPYADKFAEVLWSLTERSEEGVSRLLETREEVKKINTVLYTSDRGLCGAFNSNLIKKAELFLKDKSGQNAEISFTNFGKKGRDWCRKKNMPIIDEYLGIVGARFEFAITSTAGLKLIDGFLDDVYDEVYVIYSKFITMAKQVPVLKRILPISPVKSTNGGADTTKDASLLVEHICEPSRDELLRDILPKSVYVQLYNALLETSASEHAARMLAMDNATRACDDMVDSLTIAYNKARQAGITAELMDIVGGAEALKG